MLACKFEIWQNLLCWNSSFSQYMIHEIIGWAYFYTIKSSKKAFKTFWQIWKQIWSRNFALKLKFFFDFNPAGESQIAAKKNWKLWKCSWWTFVQRWKWAVARFWRWKFKKTIFAALLKKATFFGWKVICFVEKWKKTWKWNWYIIWSIRSCLTY